MPTKAWAATVVQVLQDLFYVLLHVLFNYFACDRSLIRATSSEGMRIER